MTPDDVLAGPDGILHTSDDLFLLPLAGAKVFLLGRESQPVITDASGFFELTNVPVGNVKLAIDGRTATNAPTGFFFPEMVLDLELEPGQSNTVMGSMGNQAERTANRDRTEVYLPRLLEVILKPVSNTQDTLIEVEPAAAPDLSNDQRAQLNLLVKPQSVIGSDGKPIPNARVGLSTVPPELVRDMLPPGDTKHTFDITVQAVDAVVFNSH